MVPLAKIPEGFVHASSFSAKQKKKASDEKERETESGIKSVSVSLLLA